MDKLKIKVVIVFISFCQGLQFTISPVLNQIQSNYSNVDISLIQMLITAPALLSMIVAVISGWLVVKISKKKLLLLGSFMTGITGFIPFLSNSFSLLFFSRTIFGVGLGLCIALNTAVVAEHFEGKERVSAMGLQGASVGTGMLIITTLGGILGARGFQYTYYIHILGFVGMIMILLFLPDTGKGEIANNEKIKLNKTVYKISVLGMAEYIFLMAFTTNIAMHLGGRLAGNSSVIGTLTGVFSGIQIFVGLMLGVITKYTKDKTLPIAMMSFGIGSILLVLFPSTYIVLLISAVFCGMSQGIFVPQAMYEVSSAVKPIAAAMASACFTVFMCFGQLISPTVLNTMSKIVFGSVNTTNVYTITSVGMIIIPIIIMIIINNEKKQCKNRQIS